MDAFDEVGHAVDGLVAWWRAHPQSADTAEGIRMWWFGGLPPSRHVVEQALQRLVDDGRVAAVTAADGRVRYRWRGDVGH